MATPQTEFSASDIAYFGADIQSTNASISGLTLRSVCLFYNGGKTVQRIFSEKLGCTAIAFTTLPNMGGKNPVFSVHLAQTRILTQDTGLLSFTVKATVDVTWTNGKRDLNTARVNIVSFISISPDSPQNESYTSSGTIVSATIFVIILLLLL